MAFSRMAMAVAATALALLAPAVHAEAQDVLQTATSGAFEVLEQEMAMVTSGDRVFGPELNTTYSNYLELNDKYVMTVSSYYSRDKRTSQSYWVCGTKMKGLYMTVKFSANPEDEDVLMQVKSVVGHSWAAKNTHGWYLSVLEEIRYDTLYRGFIRLSIQPDKSKATKWYLTKKDPHSSSTKNTFLRVRDAPGAPRAKDMYLAAPSAGQRDTTSRFLAVSDPRNWPASVVLK